MAVKRRQAKLEDLHDTMRVVDVSCASVLYSQVLWACQIQHDHI